MGPNPNFPSNLDIIPSVAPTQCRSDVDSQNRKAADYIDVRFDTAAQADAIRTYGIAGRVWEASYAMLAYLDRNVPSNDLEFDPSPFTSANLSALSNPLAVIELGSGTGLVAARVAEYLIQDRDVLYATDLADVCPLLENNLRECPTVRVLPLAWGDMQHALDIACGLHLHSLGPSSSVSPRYPTHIICSDLVCQLIPAALQ
ncbi:hypothetical protein AcW1_008007 [Taiwanofungus camphoratus]|nr:hypothetical protein AcW1_008007 [Antrodia cinnamomea]